MHLPLPVGSATSSAEPVLSARPGVVCMLRYKRMQKNWIKKPALSSQSCAAVIGCCTRQHTAPHALPRTHPPSSTVGCKLLIQKKKKLPLQMTHPNEINNLQRLVSSSGHPAVQVAWRVGCGGRLRCRWRGAQGVGRCADRRTSTSCLSRLSERSVWHKRAASFRDTP